MELRGARALEPADWLPPVLLSGWAALEVWGFGLERLEGPRWAAFLAVLVGAVVLTQRRVRPLLVAGGVLATTLVHAALFGAATSLAGVLVLVVAVFACGRHGRRPHAYLAVPAAVVTVLAVVALDGSESVAETGIWALHSVWIFALGAWFRQKERLLERTRLEEVERGRAAVAEERLRIARELHDVLSQTLSLMVVQAEVADVLLDQDKGQGEQARAAVQRVQDAGRAGLEQAHQLLGVLRDEAASSTVPLPGLADVPGLLEQIRSTAGLQVTLVDALPPGSVTEATGRAIYRIVQEALTNAIRHAGAAATTVHLQVIDGDVVVEVENDGPLAVAGHQGHGLLGMRERVEQLGGALAAGPRAGGGFAVRARIPGAPA